MKKTLLSLVAIASITFSVHAQTERSTRDNKSNSRDHNKNEKTWQGKKQGKMQHHDLAKKLNLTDAQKTELQNINTSYRKQLQHLKGMNKMSAEQLQSKKYELRKQKMEKTIALLTPEQRSKMAELKKENGEKRKMGSAKRFEKMQTRLGLSDEQVEKMKTQKELFTSKEERIKNNQSLSMEQKKEQMRSLKQERMNSYKSVLTEDQQKKMEDMKHKKSMKTS